MLINIKDLFYGKTSMTDVIYKLFFLSFAVFLLCIVCIRVPKSGLSSFLWGHEQ